jgi:cytochrome oxidase Cu insertion factor (SCO1/SenC/PrrC family)
MRLFAHAPTWAIALLALAAGLLGGSLPALAANPISPREATAEIGGQFTLVDQDGHTITDAQFRGKWLLVYFGYTHCPDACPTALTNLADALDQIGPQKRQKVQAIFITVDPERDTPAVMKDYVNAFEGAGIIGLTGTAEQIGEAEAVYRIHARRYDFPGGDYAMSHAATVDIMDPDGHFVAMAFPERIGERLAQLVP